MGVHYTPACSNKIIDVVEAIALHSVVLKIFVSHYNINYSLWSFDVAFEHVYTCKGMYKLDTWLPQKKLQHQHWLDTMDTKEDIIMIEVHTVTKKIYTKTKLHWHDSDYLNYMMDCLKYV